MEVRLEVNCVRYHYVSFVYIDRRERGNTCAI